MGLLQIFSWIMQERTCFYNSISSCSNSHTFSVSSKAPKYSVCPILLWKLVLTYVCVSPSNSQTLKSHNNAFFTNFTKDRFRGFFFDQIGLIKMCASSYDEIHEKIIKLLILYTYDKWENISIPCQPILMIYFVLERRYIFGSLSRSDDAIHEKIELTSEINKYKI